jgi:hypothetical protein
VVGPHTSDDENRPHHDHETGEESHSTMLTSASRSGPNPCLDPQPFTARRTRWPTAE